MIPAALAAPAVVGGVSNLVGGAIGSVAGLFSTPSSQNTTQPPNTAAFNAILNRAHASVLSSATGSMTTADWSTLSAPDLHSWLTSLHGRHVNAVDTNGKAVSGTVDGTGENGGQSGLNIGGHFVPLSHLTQVSWSPAAR